MSGISRRYVGIMAGLFGLLSLMTGMSNDGSVNDPSRRFGWLAMGIVLILGALYVAFGSAKPLKDWDTRNLMEARKQDAAREAAEAERKEAERLKELRRSQGLRGLLFGYTPPSQPAKPTSHDADVAAAQVRAVSNPETARALQNLQNLLYTQAISDVEFQSAKDRLLRSETARAQDDAFAQLQKLVELHEAGILNDVEFSAAKMKVLDL